ncbi:MAG TPA: hypothetical protein VLV78_04295 [Thermoanaerobaculia bacterium]|nr:hypothetical protein [Thermoanaerobaculia bacterium]
MRSEWNPARLTTESRIAPAVALTILALFAAATLYVSLHHEPWRDEADSWLVVRDASFAGILTWTRDAGTPALWYALLKPLVWAGLPFEAQSILHLVLAWAAAAVFLFRSPFTRVTQVLVLGSYYFAYEYAVIARSYVLTILLGFVLAAWYPCRRERPIRFAAAIALLVNANVHGGIIAAIFGLLFLLDRPRSRRSLAAVAIMLVGAIAAWAQLRTATDTAFPHVVRVIRPMAMYEALASAFFPGIPMTIGIAGAVVLLALLAATLRRRTDALLLLGLSTGLLGILYVLVWFGGYRHAGLLFVCAILALWVAGEIPPERLSATTAAFFHLALIVSVVFSLRMAAADVKMAFSGAREMGTFIQTNHLDRFEIAAHDIHPAEAVLPWVPNKQLWYAAIGRYGTYMRWNAEEEIGHRAPYPVAIARAVQHFAPQGRPWLLLLNAPLRDPEASGFRLIHRTGGVYRHLDECYWLYEWVPGSMR